MDFVESAVAYNGLPISSGGAHALGRISPRDSLAAWRQFLATCTKASMVESWFELPVTPGLAAERHVVRLIESEFSKVSGRFTVPWERVEDAISLLESIEPLPTNQWGMAPIWLWFTADFKLKSPSAPGLWPEQDPALFGNFQTPGGVTLGSSSTRLIIQAKRSMGLSLSIPRASDSDLAVLIPWLEDALPMRLSSKHWTRWTLSKNNRSYRGTKIVPVP